MNMKMYVGIAVPFLQPGAIDSKKHNRQFSEHNRRSPRGPTLAKILYEISKSQISGLDFGFLSKISDFISLIKSVKIVDEKIRALFFESRFE